MMLRNDDEELGVRWFVCGSKTVFASAGRQRGIDTCILRAFLEKPTDKAYKEMPGFGLGIYCEIVSWHPRLEKVAFKIKSIT